MMMMIRVHACSKSNTAAKTVMCVKVNWQIKTGKRQKEKEQKREIYR